MPPGNTPPRESEEERIQRLRRAMYSRSLSPKIKDRPRRELIPERPVVGDDWLRPEEHLARSMTAPRGMSATRIILRALLIAAVAFFIGAIGFFAYYFLIGGGSTPISPGNIDIGVSGPLQVTSGEPSELQISVINRNRAALELADLIITYPEGTRSPTDLITDLRTQRIPLGNIEPGGRRQGTVSAILSGNEGIHEAIKIELEYRLAGSSAIFATATQYEITFASSPLSISVEANNETIAGQPVQLTVTIASNANAPVKDALFSASYPFGFSLTSAEPKPLKGGSGNIWLLGDMAPGSKRIIVIQGTLHGESGDERVFRFSAGTRKDPKQQSLSTILADYSHHVIVTQPFLGLSVLINKERGASTGTVVGPGDSVTISVAYQNNLSTAITDAIIVGRLSGLVIDGSTVRSTDGFYRSADNTILWDKTTTGGALGNIAPNARGTVSFQFVVPNDEAIKTMRDPHLDVTVHAAGKRVSQTGVPETLQSTAIQKLRLASDLKLVAQGLYYTNPFGSSGPMPPKAGTETTYAIVFSVTNTTNLIKNATVKASLPPYVRWIGIYSPSSEKLVFNQNDSTVTWQIGDIEPGVGMNGASPKQAAIAIGFTPSTSQIGQQPPLIRGISLTGKDAATNAAVTKTERDVTTNIIGDTGFSAANATVVK